MRIGTKIVGGLFMLSGLVWFLQGINILPGSFMTGQMQWAVYGVIMFLLGAGLLIWQSRKSP